MAILGNPARFRWLLDRCFRRRFGRWCLRSRFENFSQASFKKVHVSPPLSWPIKDNDKTRLGIGRCYSGLPEDSACFVVSTIHSTLSLPFSAYREQLPRGELIADFETFCLI